MKKAMSLLTIIVTIIFNLYSGININAQTIIIHNTIQNEYDKMGLKPIQEIIEQNAEKIASPNSYDPIFVVEYVADTKNYSDVINTLNEVQRLSDEICVGIDDDYEKLKVIYKYVTDNIAYDMDAAHNSVTFDVICLKNVLATHKTTCAGYSNLFSALCQAQGFEVVNIRGASPEGDISYDNLNDETAPTNHEWNAVRFNDDWVYMDCTWDSTNRYIDGEFQMNTSTMLYFGMSLETVSVAHKAQIVDYRHFFDAPKAFTNGEFGTTVTTITTPNSSHSESIITEPPIEDTDPIYPPDEPPIYEEPYDEGEPEMTTITEKLPLPETWKATSKTTHNTKNDDSSSIEDDTLETIEDTTQEPDETTLKSPVNTNFAGIDWMKPSEKLEPYIIVVMVLGLGSAVAIAITIGMKKKK